MSKKSKNTADLKRKRDVFDYGDFIRWVAMPKQFRIPKTQRELAKKHGIAEETLSRWKNREGFWDAVREEMRKWAKDKLPNVLEALYQRATKQGSAQEVKLILEYVDGWEQKSGIDMNLEVKNIKDLQKNIEKILKK